MQQVLIILYVIVCGLLTLIILLQPGKGGGLGAMGGGGGGTMFGSRGAVGFLGKLTAWLAAIFMVIALLLARFSLEGSAVAPMAAARAAESADPVSETSGGADGAAGIEVKTEEAPAKAEEAPKGTDGAAGASQDDVCSDGPKQCALTGHVGARDEQEAAWRSEADVITYGDLRGEKGMAELPRFQTR